MDILVVDFYVAATDQELLLLCRVYDTHDVLEGAWNEALELFALWVSDHGVGFSTARLAVGEYGPVVSHDHLVH